MSDESRIDEAPAEPAATGADRDVANPFAFRLIPRADRLLKRLDPSTREKLQAAFLDGRLRLADHAPRTRGEHALFALAQRRRDLRAQRRLLERHLAACEQVLGMATDSDLAQWHEWCAALLWRLHVTKRAHARLTRERNALEARLVSARLRRGRPVTLLPPRYDLRVRRSRGRSASSSRTPTS